MRKYPILLLTLLGFLLVGCGGQTPVEEGTKTLTMAVFDGIRGRTCLSGWSLTTKVTPMYKSSL